MKPLSSLLTFWLLQFGAAQATIYVGDPSSLWRPISGNFDFHTDQQTGGSNNPSASDIVGAASNPGFLVAFNDDGSVSSIDGTLMFRVRLDKVDGNTGNPEFTNVVWVGIDADADGALDVFLGANMQGNDNDDAIEIRAPGTGLNVSPNTTTISNTAFKSYLIDTIEDATQANYNYRPVDPATDVTDPTGVTLGDVTLQSSGDPDYYLSFMVPFADIVEYLGTLSTPIDIIDTTPLRFVVATSTQVNSLNQDLGGVQGGTKSDLRWDDPGGGGMTPSFPVVPEPSSSLLLLGSLAGSCLVRRRR